MHARSDLEAFEPLGPLRLSLLGLHWWWRRWWRLGRWCGCRQRVGFCGGEGLLRLLQGWILRDEIWLVSLDLFVVMELAAASRARPNLFERSGGVCEGLCEVLLPMCRAHSHTSVVLTLT